MNLIYCHFLSHKKRRRKIPTVTPIQPFFLTKQEELAKLSDLLLSKFFIFQVRTGPKLSTPEKKKKSSSLLEERQTSSNFLTDHIQGANQALKNDHLAVTRGK